MGGETSLPSEDRAPLSKEGVKMISDTNRGHRSETAAASARSPAHIITYTVTLRRAYNAQKSQPSLYARSADNINSHAFAMDHAIANTINSPSASRNSSLAGTAITFADMVLGEAQHSRTTFKVDAFVNTPNSSYGAYSEVCLITPPEGRQSAASETAISDSRPVDGSVSSKGRETTPSLVQSETADEQRQHENGSGISAQEQQPAVSNPVSSKNYSPPTPPSSTRTSQKSSTSAAAIITTKNRSTAEDNNANATITSELTPKPSLTKTATAPPTPTSPTSSRSKVPSFIPLPERVDPLGTHARSLAHLEKIFTRYSLNTRAERRAYLHSLPHAQYADAARWLYVHRSDLWDTPEEETSSYTRMAADGYAEIMKGRLAQTGTCWEWVCIHGVKRGTRVEVGGAQLRLFGLEWVIEEGRWGVRKGGAREREVGPRGERMEDL